MPVCRIGGLGCHQPNEPFDSVVFCFSCQRLLHRGCSLPRPNPPHPCPESVRHACAKCAAKEAKAKAAAVAAARQAAAVDLGDEDEDEGNDESGRPSGLLGKKKNSVDFNNPDDFIEVDGVMVDYTKAHVSLKGTDFWSPTERRGRRSKLWKPFHLKNDDSTGEVKAICNLCGKAYPNRISSVSDHLKHCHKTLVEKLESLKSDPAPPQDATFDLDKADEKEGYDDESSRPSNLLGKRKNSGEFDPDDFIEVDGVLVDYTNAHMSLEGTEFWAPIGKRGRTSKWWKTYHLKNGATSGELKAVCNICGKVYQNRVSNVVRHISQDHKSLAEKMENLEWDEAAMENILRPKKNNASRASNKASKRQQQSSPHRHGLSTSGISQASKKDAEQSALRDIALFHIGTDMPFRGVENPRFKAMLDSIAQAGRRGAAYHFSPSQIKEKCVELLQTSVQNNSI